MQVKLSHRDDGPSKNAVLITLYFTNGKVNGKENSMLKKTLAKLEATCVVMIEK